MPDNFTPQEMLDEKQREQEVVARQEAERVTIEKLHQIDTLEQGLATLEDIPPEDRVATERAIRENITTIQREVDPEVIETLIKREAALDSATKIQIANIKRRGFFKKKPVREIGAEPTQRLKTPFRPAKDEGGEISKKAGVSFKAPYRVKIETVDQTDPLTDYAKNAFDFIDEKLASIQSDAYNSKVANNMRNALESVTNIPAIFPEDMTMREYLNPEGYAKRREYELALDQYNRDVKRYNSEAEAIQGKAESVENELNRIPIDRISEYNQEIEALNSEAQRLESISDGLDTFIVEDVANYNLAVAIYNERVKAVDKGSGEINRIVDKLDRTNTKINALNAQVERLGDAPDLPEEPQTTLPGLAYMMGSSVAGEYVDGITEASKEKTSTPEKVAANIVSVIDTTKTLFVPLFWIKDAKDMGQGEIVANSLIDVLILLPFMRLGEAPFRAVNNTIKRNFAVFFGDINFKQISPILTRLSKGIQSGNKLKIMRATDELNTLGRLMKVRGIKGADNLISKAKVIRSQADLIADTGKVRVPKSIDDALKQYGKEIDRVVTVETGTPLGADVLKQTVVTKTKGGKVAVVPVTREEAKKLGLSATDVDDIFNTVGMNREAFVREANRLVKARNAEVLDRLNRTIAEVLSESKTSKIIDFPIKKFKPSAQNTKKAIEELVDSAKESARKGIKKASEQEALKLALSRTFGESLESWSNRVRKILEGRFPKADKGLIERTVKELTQPVTKSKAAEIVEKARKYEALMNRLAKEAIAEIARMAKPAKVALRLNQMNLANAVIAVTETSALAKLYNGLSKLQQQQLANEVSTELFTALQNEQYAKAQALAKMANETEAKTIAAILTKTLTETKAATSTKALSKTLAKTDLRVKALARPIPKEEILTEAEAKPAVKTGVVTKVAIGKVKPPVIVKPIVPPPVPRVPKTKPRLKPRLKPPFPRKSDKAKRKIIAKSKGAIAWRQGQLGGRDVWHTIKYPYASENDYMTILGRKPSNTTIVEGPGSAYQTVKLRYGKAPARTVTGDIGIMDFRIEPQGTKSVGIGFTPDPQQETVGDITIGISKEAPPITERRPRLSGRGKMRISPKRPALKR